MDAVKTINPWQPSLIHFWATLVAQWYVPKTPSLAHYSREARGVTLAFVNAMGNFAQIYGAYSSTAKMRPDISWALASRVPYAHWTSGSTGEAELIRFPSLATPGGLA